MDFKNPILGKRHEMTNRAERPKTNNHHEEKINTCPNGLILRWDKRYFKIPRKCSQLTIGKTPPHFRKNIWYDNCSVRQTMDTGTCPPLL